MWGSVSVNVTNIKWTANILIFVMNAPILFIIFNRPDLTSLTFESIRKVKPNKLFIAADGPRTGVRDDVSNTDKTREIVSSIDWDCEVHRRYQTQNMGCKLGVSSSIDWFFDNVDEGIILEDDCLPDLSFYYFCEEMLNVYRNDLRVMSISGNNWQDGIVRGCEEASYYFSSYPHIWGWATWKRAWKHFSLPDNDSMTLPKTYLDNIFKSDHEKEYWAERFAKFSEGSIDAWSYGWMIACWSQSGLSIIPQKNLVTNVGFDGRGTHTIDSTHHAANAAFYSLQFPLNHPSHVVRDFTADEYSSRHFFRCFPDGKSNSLRSSLEQFFISNWKYIRSKSSLLRFLVRLLSNKEYRIKYLRKDN